MALERYRATINIAHDPPILAGEIVLIDPEDPSVAPYLSESDGHGAYLVPAPLEEDEAHAGLLDALAERASPEATEFAEELAHEEHVAVEIPSEEEIAATHAKKITTELIQGESDHDELNLAPVESDGGATEGDEGTGSEDDADDGLDSVALVGDDDAPVESAGDSVD